MSSIHHKYGLIDEDENLSLRDLIIKNKKNLQRLKLSNQNLSNIDLSKSDFSGSVLFKINFTNCNLDGADFSDADISFCDFSGCFGVSCRNNTKQYRNIY